MITIIDYGLGNIKAFENSYKHMGIPTSIARCADDLKGASKLLMPGVGSFDHAMDLLNISGMRETIEKKVLLEKIPFLGVCVGMQILALKSEEGSAPGLGWVNGSVKAFKSSDQSFDLPLPHMGWNGVRSPQGSKLFADLNSDSKFYFLHSFYFDCESDSDFQATTSYGLDFCSAISAGNIHGVQFHPEKSHNSGLQLLKNFANL